MQFKSDEINPNQNFFIEGDTKREPLPLRQVDVELFEIILWLQILQDRGEKAFYYNLFNWNDYGF